jgi:hypothetical protein
MKMTFNNTETLPQLVKAAESEGNPHLYISQEEAAQTGTVLGDEDSPSGSSMALELKLLLHTDSDLHYYSNKYEEEELYEADLHFLEGLKENTEYTILSPSDFKKRLESSGVSEF